MSNYARWVIYVDGKWAGGSFGSEAEAKNAAATLRKNSTQKIEVRPKGASALTPAPSPVPPPPPASAPSSPTHPPPAPAPSASHTRK